MESTDWKTQKINEIILELRHLGLWRKQAPEWVTDFSHKEIISGEDFAGWLQFVWLPNLQQYESMISRENYVAPQAMRFFGEDVKKGKLLQLLVELDSI